MKLLIIISNLTPFQSFNTKIKSKYVLKGSTLFVYILAPLTAKSLLGMELVSGKRSGQREVKVGMDVVHIRGEIYKHEV
jgi:hypothetical protein